MTPADFPEIPRNQYTTDETIEYSIAQVVEYAAQHAPNALHIQEGIARLFITYTFERDWGERIHLRRGIDLLIGQHKWENANAP